MSMEVYILGSILLVLSVGFILWIVRIEGRLRRFFRGSKAKSLEESFLLLAKEVERLTEENQTLRKHIANIDGRVQKSIRGVETLRFNPFKDAGSNQSFAIALLNEHKDGVVLSSLYSRERMSVFAKPVNNGTSSYDLTHEEKEVLKKASNF